MTKKEKVLNFVKKHKKELAVAAVAVVGGAVVFAVTKKKPKSINLLESNINSDWAEKEKARIAALDWKLGELTDFWDEGHCVNAIVNDITVADLGKLGEESLKIDGVTNDSTVSMVVCYLNNNSEN